ESADAAQALAVRVHDALLEPVPLEELTLEVRSSIGIAVWPDHGDDTLTLLKRADIAVYSAKTEQAGVAVYNADIDIHSPRRQAVARPGARHRGLSAPGCPQSPRLRAGARGGGPPRGVES